MPITVKNIADLIGVSASTIRLWTDSRKSPGELLAPFFSDSAKPEPGTARIFTEADTAVFQTIKTLSDLGLSFPEIVERLEAGERVEPLPADTAVSPEPPGPASAMSPDTAVSGFNSALQVFDNRLTGAHTEIAKLYRELIEVERSAATDRARLESVTAELDRVRLELDRARLELDKERGKGILTRLFGER
jgi:DNA-binding transcriptional MerR regulator